MSKEESPLEWNERAITITARIQLLQELVAGQDNDRYGLSGVFIDPLRQSVVATNGYFLVALALPRDQPYRGPPAMVKIGTYPQLGSGETGVLEVPKVRDPECPVPIWTDKGRVLRADWVLKQFPNYKSEIPKGHPKPVEVIGLNGEYLGRIHAVLGAIAGSGLRVEFHGSLNPVVVGRNDGRPIATDGSQDFAMIMPIRLD